MKTKKRCKSSRFRGSQSARRGRSARARGSGNQGGKGWAGTGKRGDQKNSLVVKITGGNNYFGKDQTLRRGTQQKKLQVINLSDVQQKASSLTSKDGFINLEGYKILGEGDISSPLKIKASAASKSVQEKIKAAKGTLILPSQADEKKVEKKEEKVPKKKAEKKSA
ncbi:MAG: uL15m family ribosomal protein [Nanoarchaeota archaeon]